MREDLYLEDVGGSGSEDQKPYRREKVKLINIGTVNGERKGYMIEHYMLQHLDISWKGSSVVFHSRKIIYQSCWMANREDKANPEFWAVPGRHGWGPVGPGPS